VEAVIAQLPVLPIDVPTARVHADLRAGLAFPELDLEDWLE
jgi:hypothetical protein